MSEESSSSGCCFPSNDHTSKLRISFLLNSTPSAAHKSSKPAPTLKKTRLILDKTSWRRNEANETEESQPQSPFESKSQATRPSSARSMLSLSAVHLSNDRKMLDQWDKSVPDVCDEHLAKTCVLRGITTGESPNHEIPLDMDTNSSPEVKSSQHISLSDGRLIPLTESPDSRSGDFGSNRRNYRFITRKQRRPQLKTNLQQKRGAMASRVGSYNFSRRACCKRIRCYSRVEEGFLKDQLKKVLLMCQADRKRTLASWIRDGAFMFDGHKVCSAFLAGAFGFSRDLQRAVKMSGAVRRRSGGDRLEHKEQEG